MDNQHQYEIRAISPHARSVAQFDSDSDERAIESAQDYLVPLVEYPDLLDPETGELYTTLNDGHGATSVVVLKDGVQIWSWGDPQ